MPFSWIIGQPLAVRLAQRWLAKDTNHPLLFYGPDGVGKRTLALEMAKALNAEPSPGHGRVPCSTCPICRRIAAGNYPDVKVIGLASQALERGEPLEKQQSLRLETILAERHRLTQSALEGRWKVSILDDAHRLTADAANVLLKLLEEPPERTAIFLLTPFRDRLFPTLLSRCQPVRFRSLTNEEMRHCLSRLRLPSDSQARLVELALGSPGRALHLHREEEIQRVRESEALWDTLPHQAPGQILTQSPARGRGGRATRQDFEDRLQHLLLPAARALRAGDTTARASAAVIQKGLQQIRQNVQPGLVYDHVLLELSRIRRP